MGGARNKNELKMFLTNMFNDRNIIDYKKSIYKKNDSFFITNN
jgi:ferrochelatase